VSGVSAAAGQQNGQSNQKRNCAVSADYFKKDLAKRFHPSTFCGSIFDILRFAFQEVSYAYQPLVVLTPDL
jgi:hypothetical protein